VIPGGTINRKREKREREKGGKREGREECE
jgi:hypothetical protein